jgi:Cu(I)/Ag(I) efflux system periplasmic protein CusF
MKRGIVLSCALALGVAFASPGFAQSSGPYQAAGVVKKVDAASGKVTIAHGPVKSLNWPPMTMAFSVKDKQVLARLAPEAKVQFQFVRQGSDYVITRVD